MDSLKNDFEENKESAKGDVNDIYNYIIIFLKENKGKPEKLPGIFRL